MVIKYVEAHKHAEESNCLLLLLFRSKIKILIKTHLLCRPKGTGPRLAIEGVNVEFAPFTNPRIRLRWFLSRHIVVGIVVLQHFPARLVTFNTAADFVKRRKGCRLGLGHGTGWWSNGPTTDRFAFGIVGPCRHVGPRSIHGHV